MALTETLRESILAEIQKRIDPPTFSTWFRHLQIQDAGEGRFRVPLPNEIYRQWVESHFRSPLEEAFCVATGRPVQLDFTALAEPAESPLPDLLPAPAAPETPAAPAALADPEPTSAAPRPPRPRVNENYTFEHFIVGPTNRLAHASALAVSESLVRNYNNPLFIHGGVGLGKTHLLQAICNSLWKRYPDADICYLSCESFVNEYISAVQNRNLESFRSKFRNADVLLIDDIHFLSEKEGSQEEFFHTFNALHEANRQIVLSSDSPAKDIPQLSERLMSRFVMGLEARIDTPTYEMRVAILRRKAETRGRRIPDDVLDWIANLMTTNIRELEGAITRLLAVASLANREIDLAFARECLSDTLGQHAAPVAIPEIQQSVCEFYRIKISDLVSNRRSRAFSIPRQIAIYLTRELTNQSLADIGAVFGNKDHSTIIYSIQKIRDLAQKDEKIKSAIDTIRTSIQRRSRR
jgi:chromosomal replication initiator protein